MENNKETTVNIANYDSHKEVIAKWIRILFACQIVRILTATLDASAAIGNIAGWLSRIVTIAIIIALFNLSVVNERYRKAALFYGISVGGGILSALLNKNVFVMVLSISSIVASYQELNAHSEITASKDAKLSARWHSLFYLDMFAGIMIGVVSIIPMIIAAFAGVDTNLLISIFSIVLALINIVLGLLHVVYLKKTLVSYRD
jgi:hypothetical protein